MGAIVPIPTTRVSDILIRQRLQTQLQSDQLDLVRLEEQISTGRRIGLPSQDAPAALRAISIQSLLEQKDQVGKNINANDLYLKNTDSALSSISRLVSNIRASALSAVGTTASDSERQAIALEVDAAINQLTDAGNQNVSGRYLFAGSKVASPPFARAKDTVQYSGDDLYLQSYGDLDLLFNSNVTGDQVFGGFSNQVQGDVNLNPNINRNTSLSDLHGGLGISRGSITVSDGTNSSTIDLSKANTVGDVINLIEAHPPLGRRVRVDVTDNGLQVQLDSGPGNLTIKEVGDGTTAASLGILRKIPAGNTPVVGSDLDPRLTLTTSLADLLGSRARAVVSPNGPNNDLSITANKNGAQFNNTSITFVQGGLGSAGSETAVYNATANTLTVTIESHVTTANQVMAAINAEGTFHADLDLHELQNDGSGAVTVTASDPNAAGTTSGGAGIDFDKTSGVQITNGGKTTTVDFSSAITVEDFLNTLNQSSSGIDAKINQAGTGFDVRTRVSGADFSIGENGGLTASQLGIRSLTTSTRLSSLNYGQGVNTQTGTDFTIQRRDGTQLAIDLTGADTIGDVLDRINNNAQNLNPATRVVAQLAKAGNGIELVNDDPTGSQPLKVIPTTGSQAAQDLGLIPVAGRSSDPATAGVAATATLTAGGANNDVAITALAPGFGVNGVQISFVDTGQGAGNETVTYNASAKTIVFDITAGATTANAIVNLLNSDSATSGLFHAALVASDGSPNNGAGTYGTTSTATLAGGTPETLTGRNTNPQEVSGVFTALLRLKSALTINDQLGIQRAIGLLDDAGFKITYAQADSGARQQGVDLLKIRLDNENTDLQSALSTDLNTDVTKAYTELTARQTAFQAALQVTSQTFKLTLLDFL